MNSEQQNPEKRNKEEDLIATLRLINDWKQAPHHEKAFYYKEVIRHLEILLKSQKISVAQLTPDEALAEILRKRYPEWRRRQPPHGL